MRTILFTGVSLLSLLVTSPVVAQDEWGVSGNIVLNTDYVNRGVSQTSESFGAHAGVDATNGSLYIGGLISRIDFENDPTSSEINLYGGVKPQAWGWTFDFAAIANLYTNQPNGGEYNNAEARIGASRSEGSWSYGASVYWTPDYFGVSEDEATYVQLDVAFKVSPKWNISGAAGYQEVSSAFDYGTWNIGTTYSLSDRIGVDLRYYDTNHHDYGDVYGSRMVGSIKTVF